MKDGDVFTAVDVARICRVDLKTIHHWAAKGKLRHKKTAGGHLRIERADLVAFLHEYAMPLPALVKRGRPRVFVVSGDESARAALVRALGRRFEVEAFDDAVAALVATGGGAPQVLVAQAPLAGVEVGALIAGLRGVEATGHVRVVVVAEDGAAGLEERGAAAVLGLDTPPGRVRDVIAQLTGVS